MMRRRDAVQDRGAREKKEDRRGRERGSERRKMMFL